MSSVVKKLTRLAKSIAKPFVPASALVKYKIARLERRYAAEYLAAKGWQRSAMSRQAIDDQGPVPWYTYPAQMMLGRVVQPHYRVFEYGCGNSSLWWTQRAAEVVSVDHDEQWAAAVRARAPSNLKVTARPIGTVQTKDDEALLDEFFALGLDLPTLPSRDDMIYHGGLTREFSAYALELTRYPRGYFDVVVIDGMARVLTAWLAAQYVKPSGFIVFDNADRKLYNDGYALLAQAGFRRIDFYGTGPVNCSEWCTSLFAKEFEWLAVNSVIPPQQVSDLEAAAHLGEAVLRGSRGMAE
jgi:SAM-dependent methyltransferase